MKIIFPEWLRAVLAIIIALIMIGVINLDYFWKNLQFVFYKPQQQTERVRPTGEKIAPNMLYIDSLGIAAPIVYVSGADEKFYQTGLQNGVVHFPGTASPGELGNCYIFGHSSDLVWTPGDYKTVFALLPRIKTGAQIIVSDSAGNKFVYTVMETKVIASNDLSHLSQGDKTKKILTLQTSYPVGTALRRFIAIAEMK